MYDLLPIRSRYSPALSFDPFRDLDNFFTIDTKLPTFSTDIIDNGDSFELNAEIPGFSKEDIKLEIENDCMTISAKHEENEEEKNTKYIKRERYYGSYIRSFDLTGIDTDAIDASYKDGVLTLTLPKKKKEEPEKKILEIK